MIIDINKLKEDQIRLSKKIVLKDEFEKIEKIAGCDIAQKGNELVAAIVVCDYKTLNVLEKQYTITSAKIPYIPEFLGFRECPALIECYSKLTAEPDILIFDGNGILHPRRFGAASQLGLSIDKPAIGVAKSLLCGEVKGNEVFLNDEKVGFELKTKEFSKPLYVSPGHRITLKTSVEIVKNLIRPPHKLPEPLHLAHRYAEEMKEKNE
ncbi:MAG: endonuclease V [Candidatus Woesearchaeota archaeon]|nr:endonuclease V [Candidatus Woesearchaeota archaeon]